MPSLLALSVRILRWSLETESEPSAFVFGYLRIPLAKDSNLTVAHGRNQAKSALPRQGNAATLKLREFWPALPPKQAFRVCLGIWMAQQASSRNSGAILRLEVGRLQL